MRLKSARIRNFRLLRDVRLEFSGDPERPLTVIRAENGSGKTSTLIALRWALYGLQGLDDTAMRLSSTNWPNGEPCEISVQLDFSHTVYNIIAGEPIGSTNDYRLMRSVTERPQGDKPNRGSDRVVLYKFSERGLEREDPPELLIDEMLPLEMKNIFFTDGDAALTFISPQLTKASRRDQVKEAIRSLLGLGLLENADSHIGTARKHFNSEVARLSGSGELAHITDQLNAAEDNIQRDRDRLKDVERQIEDLARRHEDADKRLQLALQAGDFEELAQQRTQAQAQLATAKAAEEPLKRLHQQLLQDERISLALLAPVLQKGFNHLAQLHDAGVIPSGSIPVLQERLDIGVCICGARLADESDARRHVVELIEQQRTVDDKRKVLTELYHAAKVDLQRGVSAASSWTDEIDDLERTRLNNRKAIRSATDQLKVLKDKIERIDRARINDARKERDSLLVSLTAKQDERRDLQASIDKWREVIDRLKPRQEEFLRLDKRLAEVKSRLTVTEDMSAVVRGTLEDLQQDYLARVSQRLNSLFLEMVGADPESMAELEGGGEKKASRILERAAINPDYEIVVYSADNTTLNPEYELSGAQKRALTFSFIWALTEVSRVVAPRVIDTPLGMMSGRVKRRVVELITTPSGGSADIEKQVVLFLTRDEIRGIESLIDERAGHIITFTNSDNYPIDLVNDPDLRMPEIMTCECSHRQYCHVCARRNDDQYGLVERPLT